MQKENCKHKAKKSLGQNFLKSEVVLKKIISAGEIKNSETILEIGPGKGALTEKLLAVSSQVIAIEKDRDLFDLLKEKFKEEILIEKLILVEGDILELEIEKLKIENYKIIANIPYNITGAILKKFLTAQKQPQAMILMIQHEVAQRILAKDGKESILSISVKAYGEPKMIMKVDKRYFSPAPKVNSAVIAINNISKKTFICNTKPVQSSTLNKFFERVGVDGNDLFEKRFWEIVKKGFAHKRKKVSGNLKGVLALNEEERKIIGDKRAEDLSLLDWISLTKN